MTDTSNLNVLVSMSPRVGSTVMVSVHLINPQVEKQLMGELDHDTACNLFMQNRSLYEKAEDMLTILEATCVWGGCTDSKQDGLYRIVYKTYEVCFEDVSTLVSQLRRVAGYQALNCAFTAHGYQALEQAMRQRSAELLTHEQAQLIIDKNS